jgi:hypothetical protein
MQVEGGWVILIVYTRTLLHSFVQAPAFAILYHIEVLLDGSSSCLVAFTYPSSLSAYRLDSVLFYAKDMACLDPEIHRSTICMIAITVRDSSR